MSLEQLNRIRVNAGQPELKSWKASKDALAAKISELLAAGGNDALPGANLNATLETHDPAIIEALTKKEEPKQDESGDGPLPLAESALAQNIDNSKKPKASAEPVKKGRASLARGLDTDQMARQSRVAVQMAREKEKKAKKDDKDAAPKVLTKKQKKLLKKAKKLAQLNEMDKAQIKDEAESRKPGKIAGKIDETKDPEKAKRQKDKIAAKQAARAEKPKDAPKKTKGNDGECTVAGIAKEIGMDAKVARAKLRRHEDKLTPLHTKGQDRWTFPMSAHDTIRDILKPKK